MSINQRLNFLIENQKMNVNSFSKLIGVNEGTTRNYIDRGSKPGSEYLEKVVRSIEGLNANWLLTGEGEPFKNGRELEEKSQVQVFTNGTEKKHELQAIPLYDITASAGLSALYNSSNNILDYLSIPNLPRCDGAINVKGDSMYPLLKHGDIVVFQRLQDLQDEIMHGEMYVVDMSTPHLERIYVKYVQKSDKGEDYVKLVSYNEKHHPAKDVPLKKIRAMAQVKASIRIS